MVKPELLKEYEKTIAESRNLIFKQNQEIKDKDEEISKLTMNKDNFLLECNNRANFIKHILDIIIGEAQPISKFEVIRDMFLPQIKEISERQNPVIYSNQRFLSDELTDGDFGL